jgi:hypothetical protein|tara:strand:+ start:366 stop:1691 length:1326 start_codon:yes stop_codon:yes gene_type:complete
MGNSVLISGAAKVAPKFLDIGKITSKAADKVGAIYQQIQAKKDLETRNQRAKVEGYLNNMPAGIELSKIPPAQQQAIDTWSKNQKMVYAEAAKNIGNYEVGSEEYVDAMTAMTSVKASFTNLDNNLTTFKVNKTEYLKSSSEGALSAGNNGAQGNLLAGIYTDESGMSFDPNGNLSFIDFEGNETALNNVPDFFNKDFQSADALITMNSSIYNAGAKLDGPTKNMYRQKVLNMVKKGGRETLLSLATDDLIQQGGLGIVDQDLLTNPARHVELEQAVVESYMNILNNSADVGFQKKQKTKSSNSNTSSNIKYGQATRDDLNIYEEPVTGTYNDIQGKLKEIEGKGLNDPIELQVTEINKIMKSNNSSIPDLVIQDGKVYADDGDGNGTEIDIFNNDVLVDYVINNMGKGIGDDAKMILKRKLKGGGTTSPSVKTKGDASIL